MKLKLILLALIKQNKLFRYCEQIVNCLWGRKAAPPCKMSKPQLKKFRFGFPPPFQAYTDKGLDLTSPPFAENVQTQAEKRFITKFLISYRFGLDPPPPPSVKIQSRAVLLP